MAQIWVDFLVFWKARASWKWQRLQIRPNMVTYSSGIFMWQALARGNKMSIYSINELMSIYSINELSLCTASRPTIVKLEDIKVYRPFTFITVLLIKCINSWKLNSTIAKRSASRRNANSLRAESLHFAVHRLLKLAKWQVYYQVKHV